MTPSDPATPRDNDEGRAAPRGVRASLLALGSAAVLAVYAVGYTRTRAAAEQFEFDETRRRLPASDSIVLIQEPVPTAAPVVQPESVAKPKPAPKKAVVKDTAVSPVAPVESGVVAAAPAAAPVSLPTPPIAAAPKPDSVATAVDTVRSRLKDGLYRGWGYSQHGNIEAEIEIQAGRIVNARYATCLMAWSCDQYIRHLPAQVVARQSPDVDTVTRVTQSSDAFYWAVVNALKKATA